MRTLDHRREGFALAAAVLALVIIGAIVTGGFYAATQEARIGDSTKFAGEAFYMSEEGIQDVLGTWVKSNFETIAVNGTTSVIDTVVSAGSPLGTYRVDIRRLATNLYVLESTGTVLRGGRYAGASHRMSILVRFLSLTLPGGQAAIKTFGPVNFNGTPSVEGKDMAPSGWQGCSLSDRPGVLAPKATDVTCKGGDCATTKPKPYVQGTPAVAGDPGMKANEFTVFGDFTFDDLAALADKVYTESLASPMPAPSVAGGKCSTSVKDNWGDPKNPNAACGSYFPIIYAKNSIQPKGPGAGQGLLLVGGNYEMSGNFEFFGLVIIMGSLNPTPGAGNTEIYGSVLVYNNGDQSTKQQVNGNPNVGFSSCAVDKAINNNGASSRATPLADRSWTDLTGVEVGG